MILRMWRGRASPDNPGGYPAHFKVNVAVELRSAPGFLGASLFRQERPDAIEFVVLSRWASMEAVRGFAGDDTGRAVVEPGAIAVLIDYDDRVQHFELVDDISPAAEVDPETQTKPAGG